MTTAIARRSWIFFCLLLLAACGSSAPAVTVLAEPDPPTPPPPVEPLAADDNVSVGELSSIAVAVLGNDVGLQAAQLLDPPRRGVASLEGDDRIRYDPDVGFNGTDSFTYSARDAADNLHTATVRVTVYETLDGVAPMVVLPRTSIQPEEVAVLVNDSDPQSVAVAAYYAEKRHIPAANVIHLEFDNKERTLTAAQFAPIFEAAEAAAGEDIQAYVLTWLLPYRVEGMSITSAFALGFDEKYYDYDFCSATAPSLYYDSPSLRPHTDLGVRPTMMLAGLNVDDVKALIDRGVAADNTFPTGTGHLVRTSDGARSVRWPAMTKAVEVLDHAPDGLDLRYVDNSDRAGSDTIENAEDVICYLTGLAYVPNIETNTYLPGAVADHLTSFGGQVNSNDLNQMSCRRWLDAGVTASYGTVIEPCNYRTKFPEPLILLSNYYRGQTVLEAYWKSVAWPGEGIFVGEPLARPWGRAFLQFEGGALTLKTTALDPDRTYRLMAADAVEGPFEVALDGIQIPHHQLAEITLPGAARAVYRLEESTEPQEAPKPPQAGD